MSSKSVNETGWRRFGVAAVALASAESVPSKDTGYQAEQTKAASHPIRAAGRFQRTGRPKKGFLFLTLGITALLTAGCSTSLLPEPQADRTQFFVLTGPTRMEKASTAGHWRIGIRTISVPDYLHGRDIAVRSGSNQVILDDYERWAESLESGIQRVLRLHLLQQPSVSDAVVLPFSFGEPPNVIVSVDVIRCEGETGPGGGHARFSALYRIQSTGLRPTVLASGVFDAPDLAWNSHDYSTLAELLSKDVGSLAAKIAEALPQ